MRFSIEKLFIFEILFAVFIHAFLIDAFVDWSDDKNPEKWNQLAKETLENLLNRKLNRNVAKNLILFIGDGMGISTVTAGRIRKGQKNGGNGEEFVTNMESLPHVALSKTYNIDAQTADSAGTATAYLCGVKTREGVIGLNGNARKRDCRSSFDAKLDSILKWAHKAGKSVGVVTTTRVTHASPAASYAHSAFRDWEAYDGKRFTKKEYKQGCKDIAAQLIEENSFINVVLGGGRLKFLPKNKSDYADANSFGSRIDERHLINEWHEKMENANKRHKFIWNATEFRNTDFKNYDHILGILSYDNLRYEALRDNEDEPSIEEMTQKAIELLSQNEKGYFLFVEGGRIDHGHHESRAMMALDDFVAFDNAIGKALSIVSDEDTMVVVTADHSHTFSIGGNSIRGNPILGITLNSFSNVSDANLTFTSLTYGNGPGGIREIRKQNLTNVETEKKTYIQEAAVYKKFETHGGEDVSVYSSGPMSFLFTNTIEQNFIAHAMAYSACIGPYETKECLQKRGGGENDASNEHSPETVKQEALLVNQLDFDFGKISQFFNPRDEGRLIASNSAMIHKSANFFLFLISSSFLFLNL